MATYAETRTKFKARLNRRDCTDALADGFLQDAVGRIQRVLDVPAGETSQSFTGTTFLVSNYLTIPTNYVQIDAITVNDKVVLTRAPLQQVLDSMNYGTQGASRIYCRRGSTWLIGPIPLPADAIRVDYFSTFEDDDTLPQDTVLLTRSSDLVLYGALSYAADHWSDKRGQRFEGRFTQILSDIQAQADGDDTSGNAVVAQSFQYPDDLGYH